MKINKKEDKKNKNSNKIKLTYHTPIFGGHGSTNRKEIKGKEETPINFKKVGRFFVEYKLVFFLLIPILLSFFIRMQPSYLPVTDDMAKEAVYSAIRGDIADNVNLQYPFISEMQREAIVNIEFNKFLKEHKSEINKGVEEFSSHFKSEMQDEKGQTYLLAIDPYLWYGQARNYVNNGYFGDEIVDDKPMQMKRNGRLGRKAYFSLNPWLEAKIYSIGHFFDKDFSLMKACFLLPVILITLSVIPIFFIARRLGGNLAGLFAAILLVVNFPLLGRTIAGFADTDPYQIFFPLFIAWSFLEAFRAKKRRNMIILTVVSAFLIGLYAIAWDVGWWYIFYFILAVIGIYLFYCLIVYREELKKGFINYLNHPAIKNTLIMAVFFLLFSMMFAALFVVLFSEFDIFTRAFTGPLSFMQLKEVAVTTLWPNVMTTVAEFREPSLSQIISGMGGAFFFFIALVGIVLTMMKKEENNKRDYWFLGLSCLIFSFALLIIKDLKIFFILIIFVILVRLAMLIIKKETKVDIKYALLLIIWFVGTIYASTKGLRFVLLLVPAFALAFGIAMGIIYQYTSNLLSRGFKINKYISKSIIILILCLLLVMPVRIAHAGARAQFPSMNDDWYDALIEIKEDSDDAIITSWWDFGHWFVTIAERRVTFDGGDQGNRIHWVGKSLLTSNETEAVGILRMLNCGQELAFDTLYSYNNDALKSINILNEIIVKNKVEARQILKQNDLTDSQVKNILNLTHCDDLLPQYYITSDDMIFRAGVWSHFGSWDFNRATMYNKVKGKSQEEGIKILTEEFDLLSNKEFDVYYEIQNTRADSWISDRYHYLSLKYSCKVNEETITCGSYLCLEEGRKGCIHWVKELVVNKTSMDAVFVTNKGVQFGLNSIVYVEQEEFKEKILEESSLGVTAALIPDGDSFQSILMDPQLASSMFTRLYFFKGVGLKRFKLFSHKVQFHEGDIFVWKVEW